MCDIVPYAFYDVVGVGRAGSATVLKGSNGMLICNTMPWGRWVGLYKIYKGLLEIPVADVLGIAQQAQDEYIEYE